MLFSIILQMHTSHKNEQKHNREHAGADTDSYKQVCMVQDINEKINETLCFEIAAL